MTPTDTGAVCFILLFTLLLLVTLLSPAFQLYRRKTALRATDQRHLTVLTSSPSLSWLKSFTTSTNQPSLTDHSSALHLSFVASSRSVSGSGRDSFGDFSITGEYMIDRCHQLHIFLHTSHVSTYRFSYEGRCVKVDSGKFQGSWSCPPVRRHGHAQYGEWSMQPADMKQWMRVVPVEERNWKERNVEEDEEKDWIWVQSRTR